MAIKNTDIVLYQSQDNTDNDNGGGRRINQPVEDGAVNNLFPDISRVDTVAGDVAMRKVFPVVNTDTREIYYGAHAIIRKPPIDPNVKSLLFYTDSAVDVRSQAKNSIESYLTPSYQAPFYLFGSNVEGAKAATFLQRPEELPPSVGEVFLLKEGEVEQYIRIADVEAREIVLFFNNQEYIRTRIILKLEQPLKHTFTGSAFLPQGQQQGTTDTFATQVADAAKFYGTKVLSDDALAGDVSVTVDSVFEQLVPSTKQQLPIIDIDAVQTSSFMVADDQLPLVGEYYSITSSSPLNIGRSIQPGSFSIDGAVDSNGDLIKNGAIIGKVDYELGIVTVNQNIQGSYRFRPALFVPSYTQFNIGTRVTLENQGVVFIQNVTPVPDPQSTYIDYRAEGKWYRINGNPDGSIGNGNDGLGAGLINDNGDGTATITVTLGAVPEIDSTVIFSWGSADVVDSALPKMQQKSRLRLTYQLDRNINPNDFSINIFYWQGSTTNFLTNNNTTSNGRTFTKVTGDEIYTLDTTTGVLTITAREGGLLNGRIYDTSGTSSSAVEVTYTYGTPEEVEANKVLVSDPNFVETSTNVFEYDAGGQIEKSGIRFTIAVLQDSSGVVANPWDKVEELALVSDGDGIMRDPNGDAWGQVSNDGVITIGVPTVEGEFLVPAGFEWGDWGIYQAYTKSTETRAKYKIYGFNNLEYYQETVSVYPDSRSGYVYPSSLAVCKVSLPPYIIGNFRVKVGGDRPSGGVSNNNYEFKVIGEEVYTANAANEQVGTYNRVSGEMTLRLTANSIGGSIKYSPVVLPDNAYILNPQDTLYSYRHVFKVGSGDIVNSSLILRYETANGSFVATTNADGDILGTDINSEVSYVDPITGVVFIEFNSPARPESIKYDCVTETVLPLDPELLGLDPVRLPVDGRVPIFKPGSFLVIFNEQSTDIGTPISGETFTLSRTRQSYIEVVDVNGQRLAYDQYETDRLNGSVTFGNNLNLIDRQGDALTPPMRIIDRVEDMGLCTDATVNGTVSISAPLSRDYTAGDSYIASALVWGDIGARIFNIFSQQYFDEWSDTRTQSGIPAQFDNINYPIQINNKDSFTGRWAIVFQSATTVDVISETLGTLLEDVSINSDIAPINPATLLPYFTIPSDGWGGGWVTSNVLRFNTTSGAENMWVIRSVQSGALTEQTDSIDIEIRGDVN